MTPAAAKRIDSLLNDAQPIARALAFKHSHSPDDIDDLVQEELWSLYCALRNTPRPRKPYAFARTIMQRAIFTYYNREQRHINYEVALEDVHIKHQQDEIETPLQERLTLDQYFQALESAHGPLARKLAENIIAPRDPEVCAFLLKQAAWKAEAQMTEAVAAFLRGVKTLRVSRHQLRKALGLTRSEWMKLLKQIKQFTRSWLALHNGQLSERTATVKTQTGVRPAAKPETGNSPKSCTRVPRGRD